MSLNEEDRVYGFKQSGKYDDIIALPHPVSKRRAHMSMRDRAAQFAPFSALAGYGDFMRDTAEAFAETRESGGLIYTKEDIED